MRAVVAGSTGFLGGYLLEALMESGIEPVALVREGSDPHLLDRLGVERRFGDLSDLNSLCSALRGGDIVFNAAGRVADWGSWGEFHEANVRGTAQLLSAAARNQIRRFVQVSSISAYGMRFFDSQVLGENMPYQPSPLGRDFYCKSKFLAEQEVRRASSEKGMEFVILRPGIILGERDSAVTRRIVSLVQRQRRILNVGRLKERIQFNHAKDVARAIVLAGLHGPPHEIFNISSPPEMSRSEFWSRVLRALHLRKEMKEVPYSLGLMAGWLSECLHIMSGNEREPSITLWSVYLMGNRNVIESSKIFDLGWRPNESLSESIDKAFRRYLNVDDG